MNKVRTDQAYTHSSLSVASHGDVLDGHGLLPNESRIVHALLLTKIELSVRQALAGRAVKVPG
jgi:hypothetical protein